MSSKIRKAVQLARRRELAAELSTESDDAGRASRRFRRSAEVHGLVGLVTLIREGDPGRARLLAAAAEKVARGIEVEFLHYHPLSSVAVAMAPIDSREAHRLLDDLPGTGLSGVGCQHARAEVARALGDSPAEPEFDTSARRDPSPVDQLQVMADSARGLMASDSAAAWRVVEEMRRMQHEAPDGRQLEALLPIVQVAAELDPVRAREFVLEAARLYPDASVRPFPTTREVITRRRLAVIVAGFDVELAGSIAQTMPTSIHRRGARRAVAKAIAAVDVAKAERFAWSQNDLGDTDALLYQVVAGIVGDRPDEAARVALTIIDSATRASALMEVALSIHHLPARQDEAADLLVAALDLGRPWRLCLDAIGSIAPQDLTGIADDILAEPFPADTGETSLDLVGAIELSRYRGLNGELNPDLDFDTLRTRTSANRLAEVRALLRLMRLLQPDDRPRALSLAKAAERIARRPGKRYVGFHPLAEVARALASLDEQEAARIVASMSEAGADEMACRQARAWVAAPALDEQPDEQDVPGETAEVAFALPPGEPRRTALVRVAKRYAADPARRHQAEDLLTTATLTDDWTNCVDAIPAVAPDKLIAVVDLLLANPRPYPSHLAKLAGEATEEQVRRVWLAAD